MSDRESKPGYQVAEFQSKSKYDHWLETQGSTIRVVDVSTTKRWSILAGFLGRAKTYTVTYEQNRASGEQRTLMIRPDKRLSTVRNVGSPPIHRRASV